MAALRMILRKEKTNAKGLAPVVLRLADADNKRAFFMTGFFTTDEYFDTSKNGGRFFQGKVSGRLPWKGRKRMAE